MAVKPYGWYLNYLIDMYKIFNGKINPTIRSARLVVKMFKSDLSKAGSTFFFNTAVNLPGIYRGVINADNSHASMKGVILYVLLHELSHCNQDIDLDRLISDKTGTYRSFIEITNNKNTVIFMLNNNEYIKKVSGPDTLVPAYAFEAFFAQCVKFNINDCEYKRAVSEKEEILKVLSHMVEEYLNKYSDLTVVVQINRYAKVIPIIRQYKGVYDYTSIKYLSKLFYLSIIDVCEFELVENTVYNSCTIGIRPKKPDKIKVADFV